MEDEGKDKSDDKLRQLPQFFSVDEEEDRSITYEWRGAILTHLK